jgi:predicted nuclease of predicted toxin-antitoxin system
LADENMPRLLAKRLRELGHDVVEIGGAKAGIEDSEVLSMAQAERRILLTRDKRFANMVFRSRQPVDGVILFRLAWPIPARSMIAWMESVVSSRDDWSGLFATATSDGRLRTRPIRPWD